MLGFRDCRGRVLPAEEEGTGAAADGGWGGGRRAEEDEGVERGGRQTVGKTKSLSTYKEIDPFFFTSTEFLLPHCVICNVLQPLLSNKMHHI